MISWLLSLQANAQVLALDGGSLRSDLMQGFSRLDLEGCEDPRVSWERLPQKASWFPGPDPLAGDDITGGRLALRLSPGSWAFWVMVGREDGTGATYSPFPIGESVGVMVDGEMVVEERVPTGLDYLKSPFYTVNPFPVFREGETSWDRQIAPRHRWRRFEVVVPPTGRIELSTVGIPLQGLVAAPTVQDAEAAVLVDATDVRREEWFLQRVRPHDAAPTPLASAQGDVGVQVARWLDLPDPRLARTDATMSLEGSPGERVSRVLWLFPGDGAGTWTTDLAIPVEGREVHWLDGARPMSPDPASTAPLVLRPSDGELQGEQGVPVGLAVTVLIPEDARPAIHRGTILFQRGSDNVEVAVNLRVRDLKLALPKVPVGAFLDLHAPLLEATGNQSSEVLAAMDEDIALMRARGLSMVGIRYASAWPARWKKGQEPDTSMFRTFAEHWRAAGGGTIIWWDAYEVFKTKVHDKRATLDDGWGLVVAALSKTLREVGDTVLYIYDEESYRHLGAPGRTEALRSRIEELDPDAGPFMGGILHPGDLTAAAHLDHANLHGTLAGKQWTQQLRDQGVTPRGYNFAHGRSGPGLMAWSRDVESLMQWHWNNADGDPFNHVNRKRGHHYAVLAPDGHVWMTVPGESWAEGVTDQRYLTTLQNLVEQAEASKKKRIRKRAVRGRLLVDALQAAAQARRYGVHEREAWSEDALDQIRTEVAREAERLSGLVR